MSCGLMRRAATLGGALIILVACTGPAAKDHLRDYCEPAAAIEQSIQLLESARAALARGDSYEASAAGEEGRALAASALESLNSRSTSSPSPGQLELVSAANAVIQVAFVLSQVSPPLDPGLDAEISRSMGQARSVAIDYASRAKCSPTPS